jgi:hypothetical protein
MFLLDTTRREKDEGGAKSGVRHLERMKHGNGIKSRKEKSNGIEILITEVFASVEPLRLTRQTARRKRNWPDSLVVH